MQAAGSQKGGVMSWEEFSHVERFLQLVVSSRLAPFIDLCAACEDFHTDYQDDRSVDELCDHLIEKEILTPWQCGMLRRGKWKGFFLGEYCLLERIAEMDVPETSNAYLAKEPISGRRVVMMVPCTSDHRSGEEIDYKVFDLPAGRVN